MYSVGLYARISISEPKFSLESLNDWSCSVMIWVLDLFLYCVSLIPSISVLLIVMM